MKNRSSSSVSRLCTRARQALCLAAAAGIILFTATVGDAQADTYDPKKAANPVRIVAYIVHPVGVLLDYGIARPCFWVVQREPFSTIFGYAKPWGEEEPDRE